MPKRKRGAPRKYDRKAIMKRLTEYMAKGMNIREACSQEGMPDSDSIYIWCIHDDDLFGLLTRAQELWCLSQSEKIVTIADDETKDQVPYARYHPKTGQLIEEGTRSDNTAVNRAALRIKTRSFLMSKWYNRLFGEKINQEITGKDGGPVQYESIVDRPSKETPEEWQQRVTKQMEDRAKERAKLH